MVGQFQSVKLPLVILVPVPLTPIAIVLGHWLFAGLLRRALHDRLHRVRRHHRAQLKPARRLLPPRRHPELPLRQILPDAAAIRFKPILLAALAAMVGAACILPAPIFLGLTLSLTFGLSSSTALTVLLIAATSVLLRNDGRLGVRLPQQIVGLQGDLAAPDQWRAAARAGSAAQTGAARRWCLQCL